MESLVVIPIDADEPENAVSIVVGDISLYLPLGGMLDIEAECRRLDDEIGKTQVQLERTRKMLGNENFVSRARPDVVQRERDRLVELESARAQLQDRIKSLCG